MEPMSTTFILTLAFLFLACGLIGTLLASWRHSSGQTVTDATYGSPTWHSDSSQTNVTVSNAGDAPAHKPERVPERNKEPETKQSSTTSPAEEEESDEGDEAPPDAEDPTTQPPKSPLLPGDTPGLYYLEQAGIETWSDLKAYTDGPEELTSIKGIAEKRAKRIVAFVEEHGL